MGVGEGPLLLYKKVSNRYKILLHSYNMLNSEHALVFDIKGENMYSYVFPNLNKWFTANNYVQHNGCEMLEVNMKAGLTAKEIDEFCLEFAKYICSIRCSSEQLYLKMVDAIENGTTLLASVKRRLQDDFYSGFIKDEAYKATGVFSLSYDEEGIQGHLGEALYYLIRNQYSKDLKIAIEPSRPKAVAKTSGIDFLEVRKDAASDFYFIIGEVKTTTNSYSKRNSEVVNSFLNRINRNFSEIYLNLKERDDGSDPDYTRFLEEMTDIFYSFKGRNEKRIVGVFNYNYKGRRVSRRAFSTWKDKPFDINDSPICRKIKLVGIYNIDVVIEKVRDLLWSVL